MRPFGSAKQLHQRRLRAMELLKQGFGPTDVAKRLNAHRRTVQRWARKVEAGGRKALEPKAHPGPRPKLTLGQKQQLSRMLLKGAKACGFSTDLWTCPRVAHVIRKRFGVRYHVDHIGRFLRALGWTPQKPQRKAYERDEDDIAGWVKREWPRIKKSPEAGSSPRVSRRMRVLHAADRPAKLGATRKNASLVPCGTPPR